MTVTLAIIALIFAFVLFCIGAFASWRTVAWWGSPFAAGMAFFTAYFLLEAVKVTP